MDRSFIIRGITEEYKESESSIIDKIHHILSEIMQGETKNEKLLASRRIVIKSCKCLGQYIRSRIRPVSVELLHKKDANFILDNRFDLAKGVFVDREYPAEIERKRKTLLPILKAAKRIPDYKRQSKLEDNKLVLKGRSYTVNMLNQLPDKLNSFKVTSKEDENTVGFFKEINPLSNFYPSSFNHEGTNYISSEQFIQANKAKYFGDYDRQSMILGCTTSSECKNLAKQIRNVNDSKWDEVAGNICYPGIQAKFYQNPYAMDCLIQKTGSKRIVECATDRLWATGVPLGDPASLDETKWISPGIFGQILENIRSEYLSIHDTSTNYHYQSANIGNPSLPPSTEAQVHRVTTSAPQAIPGVSQDCQPTSMDGSLSVTDSASASTSTTPVSDTTATDTDSGECAMGAQQHSYQGSETPVIIPE